ncbi:hypothetical protein BS78_01G424700 [Paspalum vaginatum]|nr:hypothetical protein BS78_01G424700 [Paspalum vaginatum]
MRARWSSGTYWCRHRWVTSVQSRRLLLALPAVLRPRRLSPLPPPRLLAVAIAFAFALLFLVLVLLTTSPPSPPPRHAVVAATRSPRYGAANLGELGDTMLSMLPTDLPFTVFVPSPDSFRRVLRLQGRPANGSAAVGGDTTTDSDNTYAVLSRVLGFSAVPRRLLAADVPRRVPVRLMDSVSGLRIYASRDDRGALVVNGVRSECVDVVRGLTVVHVMAGVLMDAEFERSFSVEFDGWSSINP